MSIWASAIPTVEDCAELAACLFPPLEIPERGFFQDTRSAEADYSGYYRLYPLNRVEQRFGSVIWLASCKEKFREAQAHA